MTEKLVKKRAMAMTKSLVAVTGQMGPDGDINVILAALVAVIAKELVDLDAKIDGESP